MGSGRGQASHLAVVIQPEVKYAFDGGEGGKVEKQKKQQVWRRVTERGRKETNELSRPLAENVKQCRREGLHVEILIRI